MQRIPKRLTLVHQVEGILRDGIRAGEWARYLPGEMELCQRLQVSRTTLRAALATLTREKWLRSARGRFRQIVKRNAPRLEAGRTGRILLLTGAPVDLLGGTPMFLLDELRQQLAQAGFDLEVHAGRGGSRSGPRRRWSACCDPAIRWRACCSASRRRSSAGSRRAGCPAWWWGLAIPG